MRGKGKNGVYPVARERRGSKGNVAREEKRGLLKVMMLPRDRPRAPPGSAATHDEVSGPHDRGVAHGRQDASLPSFAPRHGHGSLAETQHHQRLVLFARENNRVTLAERRVEALLVERRARDEPAGALAQPHPRAVAFASAGRGRRQHQHGAHVRVRFLVAVAPAEVCEGPSPGSRSNGC